MIASSRLRLTRTTHSPQRSDTNDEIMISIQQQDLYTLLYENFLYFEGKLTKNKMI